MHHACLTRLSESVRRGRAAESFTDSSGLVAQRPAYSIYSAHTAYIALRTAALPGYLPVAHGEGMSRLLHLRALWFSVSLLAPGGGKVTTTARYVIRG